MRDGAGPEGVADDGCVLRHAPLRRLELVDARSDQRLQARGDRNGLAFLQVPTSRIHHTLVHQHLNRLLEEERIPARALQQRLGRRIRGDFFPEQLDEQRAADVAAQRLELDRDPPLALAHELGHRLDELRSRGADDQQRRVRFVLCDVADQLDQRRLGPVEVLEDEDERASLREELDEATESPVELGLRDLGRRVRPARRGRDAEDVRRGSGHRA